MVPHIFIVKKITRSSEQVDKITIISLYSVWSSHLSISTLYSDPISLPEFSQFRFLSLLVTIFLNGGGGMVVQSMRH